MDGGVILKSKPDQFIMDEWSCMTKTAAQNLKGDCPMLEDAVLSDMAKYIKELEEQNKKLTEISIGLLEFFAGHLRCCPFFLTIHIGKF